MELHVIMTKIFVWVLLGLFLASAFVALLSYLVGAEIALQQSVMNTLYSLVITAACFIGHRNAAA